jgi:hypothetical protein
MSWYMGVMPEPPAMATPCESSEGLYGNLGKGPLKSAWSPTECKQEGGRQGVRLDQATRDEKQRAAPLRVAR